jgi:hypothetical protein
MEVAIMNGFWNKTAYFILMLLFGMLVYLIGTGVIGSTMLSRWYFMMGVMVLFLIALGYLANRRWDGILIDWRNKMSLSRLQMIIWTVLGVSAFLTLGLGRVVMSRNGTIAQLSPANALDFSRLFGGITCLEGLERVEEDDLAACPEEAPLEVTFPEELLLAMGISVASFAGSSLVKRNNSTKDASAYVGAEKEQELRKKIESAKMEEKAAADALQISAQAKNDLLEKQQQALEANKPDEAALIRSQIENLDQKILENRRKSDEFRDKRLVQEKELEKVIEEADKFRGMVHTNATPAEASWNEMFAEEGKSHERIDLSKVQMFFITIAVILAYAGAINNLLQDPLAVANPFGVALPSFSSSLVLLLGISHGGYLTMKSSGEPQ